MKKDDIMREMLVAFAAAKKNPSLRMKRNDVEPGKDICVLVDANGDFADKEGVDSEDPRTWPCVIMLFGSDIAGAQKRVENGENPVTVPTHCSRFYALDPFNPAVRNKMTCVGDDISPNTALVKVAER